MADEAIIAPLGERALEALAHHPLFDMHCHLGFATNAVQIAARAAACSEGMLSCGVDPRAYASEGETVASSGAVRVGLGLHPWWIERVGQEGHDAFFDQLPAASHVGEIGLDHGARHGETFEQQQHLFREMCAALARHPGKVVSIHAVKSVDEVLDALEATGALADNACILHWFSGTSQQLTRALRAGCYISLGTASLSGKRGQAYARQVQQGKLLLETDYPPERDTGITYEQMHAPLIQAAEQLVAACGYQALEAACIASKRLLQF